MAIHRFISQNLDQAFFEKLKEGKKFEWTSEYGKAI